VVNGAKAGDGEATRRGLYGCARQPPAVGPGAKVALTASEVSEPIYDVIDLGRDDAASAFSPGVTPWDEEEDDEDVEIRVSVCHQDQPCTRQGDISLKQPGEAMCAPAIPHDGPRPEAQFAIEPATPTQPPGLPRRESSIELGVISGATGESRRWERVQRIRVPAMSIQDAEALLLRHERGPGTFLFREHAGKVVLTLWDGTSVHHFDVRDHDAAIKPAEFQGSRFRDFVRCFRGGASGSLPSALRHLVMVGSQSPPSPRASLFTVHSLCAQSDLAIDDYSVSCTPPPLSGCNRSQGVRAFSPESTSTVQRRPSYA